MKQIIAILIASFFLGACSRKEVQTLVKPVVKYELSGGAGHYDYAPSAIVDKYGICYMFLCENKDPFKIVDHVYLYKGIPSKNGYSWQPGTMIVSPSPDGWDNCHICDPDVREFKCSYKGEQYNWIMTYLGVDQWDCNHNQIGLAVSKCIEGPWIKYDRNPIIKYDGRDHWGVGQSTSVIIDKETVRVFYHSTIDGKGLFVSRDLKLNDLDNITMGEEKIIPNVSSNSYPAFSEKNIYLIENFAKEMSTEIPTWVGNVVRLEYQPVNADIYNPDSKWIEIGSVGPEESGFPRNHNPGLLTDTKGYVISDDEIVSFFTTAVTGDDWLWSYDLYSARFDLKSQHR